MKGIDIDWIVEPVEIPRIILIAIFIIGFITGNLIW